MGRQGQFQEQRLSQVQRLSPQQYLLAKLVELPLTGLEQRVRDELYENVALTEGKDKPDEMDRSDEPATDEFDPQAAGEEAGEARADEADELDFSGNEELPVFAGRAQHDTDAEIPIGDTRSFIEDLQAQIAEYDVTPHQRELIEYLIGSLDDRGFVERPLRNIADDLLFNHNVETDERELEEALRVLQQFDPTGIGARSLQECLLLQINRLLEETAAAEAEDAPRLQALRTGQEIVARHFSLLERKETERLARAMGVGTDRVRQALLAISRLNPHPGRSLHEAADDRAQTIVPDFIVETDHESSISFSLNTGEIPALRVSSEYLHQLKAYQANTARMSRSEREAFAYTKQKVEAAQMFIAAIRQRQETLTATMAAIIGFQRDFFLSQDDYKLRPLRLDDVAKKAGVNISTVSRVINSKYALLDGTLYPLKYFFLRAKANAAGKEVVKTKICPLLREIIDTEDKRNPLSDEQISALMHERGEAISRRTVAKYRDEMGIPVAILRKQV